MNLDEEFFDIGRLDRLSYKNSPVHRLDPRVKLIATLLFLFTVISFSKYEISGLLPLFLFPLLLTVLGEIPLLFILKKVLWVSPFAVFIGIFNPLLDTNQFWVFPGFTLAAGWVSFFSILLKFFLTISAALLLIATTPFPNVCHALRSLGLPLLFVSQLLFLYRYLFVLTEEVMRMVRARDMRSFGEKGTGIRVFIRIIGTLFLRTLERAERIYSAMLSRGFRGDLPILRPFRFRTVDLLFLAVTASSTLFFRFYPVTQEVGRLAQELLP